jgi:uncharacterized SAM-binding protein YcdF (DUF218 family)
MQGRYTGILILVVIALAVLFWTRESILLAIGDFLVVRDTLRPADVIHVISGADYRTNYGIKLYKQGYGKKIFFTGGWCNHHKVNHAQHARELAIERGVQPQDIFTDEAALDSTYAEAERLKEFIMKSPSTIDSVLVVSDPHHMWRARWAYRGVLGSQISIVMAPVPFHLSPYHRRWWIDCESRKMVREEYLKILYYLVRYRFSWGPFRKWLASLDRN